MNRRLVTTLVLACAVLLLGTGLASAARVTMYGVITWIDQQAGTLVFQPVGYPEMELTASPRLLQGFQVGSWVEIELEGITATRIYHINALEEYDVYE